MAIGQGGIDYDKVDRKKKKQIQKNESRIRQDYDYVQSEIDRAKDVIKQRQERGQDIGAQEKYLNKLEGQLDSNPTFMRRSYKDETQDRIQSEVQNEIEKRKRSIANDMQEQRQANRSAIQANENFLQEQIENYKQQQAEANRDATQLQNRRGGFYSGGLDYQRGQIARSTNEAIENTSREVAQRNADLRERNAMISRQASEAIRALENEAPDMVRSRVIEAMERWDAKKLQEGQLTGTYMGQPTLQAQQAEFQNAINQASLTGVYRGQPTLQAQQISQQDEDRAFKEAVTRLNAFGSVQTEEDAAILGVPVGTTTYQVQQDQLARQDALRRASSGGSRGGSSSGGGSYGGSNGGGTGDISSLPSWESLDYLDRTRITDMYQNGTPQQQQYIAQKYPDVFGQSGNVDTTQRELDYITNEFSSMFQGDLTQATPDDVNRFVTSLYVDEGWTEQEANYVENYINQRINREKEAIERQQTQQERQERQERKRRQEITRPNAIYDPSNFGKGL